MGYDFEFSFLLQYGDVLLRGIWLTIKLTAISVVVGLAVGVAGAAAKTSSYRVARWIAGAYVELIRNTPFLVQLFLLFFGLSSLGVKLSAEQAALLAMVINLGAYSTEIVRAGIHAVQRGQIEAAESLALSRLQIFRHVILVPALEKIYPALTSQFVIIMLGSAVVSQISAEELTWASNFIQSRTFRSFEAYFVVGAIYLALSLSLRQVFRVLGTRLFAHRQRA
ncbi:MAG: amino acid ABC transporter permease [Rubrivivax sp.]